MHNDRTALAARRLMAFHEGVDTAAREMITVITPTISSRVELLAEAKASVTAQTAGPPKHLVSLDLFTKGPATIRNALAAKVDTPWMLFLDDDDVLDPSYLETVAPVLYTASAKTAVVYTWCHRSGFDANFDRPFDAELLRQGNYIPVTACVRTDVFRRVGGMPTDVAYEDWSLWLQILDAGYSFECIPQRLWTYRRQAVCRTIINDNAVAQGLARPA